MSRARFCSVAVALLFACTGCGDGDAGPAGADCPDLQGSWVISAHCDPTFVGMTVTVDQTGCDFSIAEFSISGSLAKDGAFTSSGDPSPGVTVDCTGQASASEITESCNSAGADVCAASLTRQ